MIDRTGQLWDLGEKMEWGDVVHGRKASSRHRILVVESKDIGNGRTLQKYYFIRNGLKDAYGEDTEYADLPWEQRKERTRIG